MNNEIDPNSIVSIEFGVTYDTPDGESMFHVPVDDQVKTLLNNMLRSTLTALDPAGGEMESFSPAQKYSSTERLTLPTNLPEMEKAKAMFSAENLAVRPGGISETDGLVYYFAFFVDGNGRKVLAVRRAAQFKGLIAARNRVVRMLDNTLKVIESDIFKLDNDFDYLIFQDKVWILRPSGFEFTIGIEKAFEKRAGEIVDEVSGRLNFVDFGKLKSFVVKHKRAARLVASLKSRADLHETSIELLKDACSELEIGLDELNGKVQPVNGQEIAFLELLDRRRYEIELIAGKPERFVAHNRAGV